MYSVVLMVAATSGGDMSSFGNKGSCNGMVTSCNGCSGGGFLGLRSGGGLFHKNKGGCHGCSGSCYGTYAAGCSGAPVVVAPAPVAPAAPVVVAPTGCSGSMYYSGCQGGGSSCHGCSGGGFLGMRNGGGLFHRNKGGCCGGCW